MSPSVVIVTPALSNSPARLREAPVARSSKLFRRLIFSVLLDGKPVAQLRRLFRRLTFSVLLDGRPVAQLRKALCQESDIVWVPIMSVSRLTGKLILSFSKTFGRKTFSRALC